jgi:hypothetical protein
MRRMPAGIEPTTSGREHAETTDRTGPARARPARHRNCECGEFRDNPACHPSTVCDRPGACIHGSSCKYTAGSRRSGFPALNRRISLAGTMWSTCRRAPACLKSWPHDSTSHFSRSAETLLLRQPFRVDAVPGHFLSTPPTTLPSPACGIVPYRTGSGGSGMFCVGERTVLKTSFRLSPQYGQCIEIALILVSVLERGRCWYKIRVWNEYQLCGNALPEKRRVDRCLKSNA